MTTYYVTLTQVATHTVTVEAGSVEEAIQEAESDAYAGLCHQCSNGVDLDPTSWEVPDEHSEDYVTEVSE